MTDQILMSIRPRFAEANLSGTRRFEFRRTVPVRAAQGSIVVVYASSPVRKVIGEFRIARILTDDVRGLWKMTSAGAGITEEEFIHYFRGKSIVHAIEISDPVRYAEPLPLGAVYAGRPPQSFAYIRRE